MLMNLPTAPATEFHEQSRLKTIPLPACFKADGEKAAQAISSIQKPFNYISIMIIPEEFNDIRPYEPEELPAVYDRLVQNPQFLQMVSFLFPEATPEIISQKMHECKTNMDFQLVFAYRFLKKLISKASTGLDMDVTAIDNKHNYTFMSNHRDIVLDSALLDVLLIDHGFETTCEIAIGDNLLSIPWVLDVVRLNKSFIVKRGLMARERLQASQKLARYMHFAISEKHQNFSEMAKCM